VRFSASFCRLGTLKGRNMCLHSYTFVFSLQDTEGNLTFDDLLKPDNRTYRINQKEFDGFSFVNHGVAQWYIGQPDLWHAKIKQWWVESVLPVSHTSCPIIYYIMLQILLRFFTASVAQLMIWDGRPYDATVMWLWQLSCMIS